MARAGHKSFSCQHGHVPCFIIMPDCVMRQEMIKAKFSKGKTKMQVHTHFPNFSPGPPSQAQTTRQSFWETQTVCPVQNQEGNGSRVARGLRSRRGVKEVR